MRTRLPLIPLVLLILGLPACRKAEVIVNEVVAVPATTLPLNPGDPVWQSAPVHIAKLLLQDLVEPRLMTPSTADVRVRSLTNGANIAFRLEWVDAQQDDKPGPGLAIDSCAVQIPRKIEASAPDPQMGMTGRFVDIVAWRADWQATINGRGDTIRDLYPNASIDHYPFEARSLEKGSAVQKEMAKRYSPAEAVGNRRAGPRAVPVEDLVADGPATLMPAAATTSKGQGVRTKDGWAVVMERTLPEGLSAGARTQIAFAVWEGGHGERGSRKMRTGWIPLLWREAAK